MEAIKIFFDNIVYGLQRSGGISVVWYELLQRISKTEGLLSPHYIDLPQADNYYRQQLQIDSSQITSEIKHPKYSRYLPVAVNSSEPFIFHSSYYRYCTSPRAVNITTVHDFTYELYRSGLQRKIHSWQKFNAIRHSEFIVCVSENTKRDLLTFLPDVDETRVRVIYNGASDDYFVINERETAKTKANLAPKSFVLFIGDRQGYKHFDLCVNAVSQTDYHLVIVGKDLTPEEKKSINSKIPESRYHLMGYVPNSELNILYNQAAALIYPSAYEGFGIPVLEAQKAGCPVIACNNSSIPEVIASQTLLLNKPTEQELVGKLKLLTDEHLMKEVIDKGIHHTQKFSWDKMAGQYIALYQEALSISLKKESI